MLKDKSIKDGLIIVLALGVAYSIGVIAGVKWELETITSVVKGK